MTILFTATFAISLLVQLYCKYILTYLLVMQPALSFILNCIHIYVFEESKLLYFNEGFKAALLSIFWNLSCLHDASY